MDGRDRDNIVVVAHPTVVRRDKADLVHVVVSSVANRVTAKKSAHSVHTRDHHYHIGAYIARVGLHLSRGY